MNKFLALGRPHGTHSFWQQVCVLFTHIVLAEECNVFCSFFFFLVIIKYLVGNFTLALTDLAEAA